MLLRKVVGAVALVAVFVPTAALAQTAVYSADKETIDKIKDEGLNRSQVMQTLSYMSDVIGPRLTASPGMKRANEWTRDTLAKWGMQNAHLESWGPFGRGWSLKRFYAMVDGPTAFPMIAYPKAWSPGTDTLMAAPAPAKKGKAAPSNSSSVFSGEVVHFTATKEEELDQYKGKLKGKIVLVGPLREVKAHFDAEGKRLSEKELLNLADAPQPAPPAGPRPAGPTPTPNPQFAAFQTQQQFNARRMRFLADEGAAILIDAGRGDGGAWAWPPGRKPVPGPRRPRAHLRERRLRDRAAAGRRPTATRTRRLRWSPSR